jgi:hypothetical protein
MRCSCLAFAAMVAIGFVVQPLLAGTIVNGGFETGDLTGWSYQTSGDGSASVTVESGAAAEGTHYARLYASAYGMSSASATLTQEFDALAGDRLSFSYLDNTQGNMFVGAEVSPGDIHFSIGPYNPNNIHGEWTEAVVQSAPYGYYYEFPTSGHYTFSVSAQAMNATADLGIDAVQLTRVPEPSTFVFLGISAIGFLANAWRRRTKAE